MSSTKTKFGKARLVILHIGITLAWIILFSRLVTIQIVHGSEYGNKARSQSTGKASIQAERGIIYDRTGREVAINIVGSSLYAYPKDDSEIKNINRYLDRLNGLKSGTSARRYNLQAGKFKWLNRNISDEQATRIAADSIPGLYLLKALKRDYPFDQIGRQLLGNTDVDGKGLSGLEYSHDSLLSGTPGLMDFLRDGKNNTFNLKEIPLVKPVAGKSIVLTLDWYFQEIVEEELKSAVETYGAKSGMAIFLNCQNGEILAAADYAKDSPTGVLKLRAVSDCFEPGSVMKVATVSALLDEKLVDMEELIYCENGIWQCGRGRLRDDKKHGSLNLREIVELSSNIGVGKLAQRLGGKRLSESLEKFNFGKKLRVDLPGEVSGSIADPGVWSTYNTAALSIGHSVSTTALQLAAAIGAIANGGELYRPHVIRGIINSDSMSTQHFDKELIGRVARKESTEILRSFLAGVVERGTATPAKSDIISIAGKTGTAEIPDPENGGYIKNKFYASFLGYFPADNPQIAGVVVLYQPEPIHYAGYTAGPAFKLMAERYTIANNDIMKPSTQLTADADSCGMIEMTDFVGRDFSFAQTMAERDGFTLKANRNSGLVVWQYPPAGRLIPGGEQVAVLVESPDESGQVMGDLTGLNMRTALAMLNYQGIKFEIQGNGIVREQYPECGTKLDKDTLCRLVCYKSQECADSTI